MVIIIILSILVLFTLYCMLKIAKMADDKVSNYDDNELKNK